MAFEVVAALVCIAIVLIMFLVALPGKDRKVRGFLASEARQAIFTLVLLTFIFAGTFLTIDAMSLLF
ncbi:hypothetical protein FO470_05050 [Starkeya sp. 3C]|uniref:Uncharacterized protein n=1 Tax=Ancylobacter moscoviensis TaxID=2597768 RepID=A0ABY3DWS1_9HYPH|nr:hypothetical protein [Ancylobacter moscoviensis]TSJ64627.1 hypothetical protein FO470_05050 [Ancylobacter moscoviensis]